jgi:hypothetical protein
MSMTKIRVCLAVIVGGLPAGLVWWWSGLLAGVGERGLEFCQQGCLGEGLFD